MDAPFEQILKITRINSKILIADDKWKMRFLNNAPVGWETGDRIRLSESPKLGLRVGSQAGPADVPTSRVQVRNLDKKSLGITLYFQGSLLKEKSVNPSSEPQLSLKKNIRLDREAFIKKIHAGHVIDVEDAEGRLTKWQIDTTAARGRMEWFEGDAVVISKGISATRFKIINKDQGDQSLGAVFISED